MHCVAVWTLHWISRKYKNVSTCMHSTHAELHALYTCSAACTRHMQRCMHSPHAALHALYTCSAACTRHMQRCMHSTHAALHALYTCSAACTLHMQRCMCMQQRRSDTTPCFWIYALTCSIVGHAASDLSSMTSFHSESVVQLIPWCSGYHVSLTHSRSPVRSRVESLFFLSQHKCFFASALQEAFCAALVTHRVIHACSWISQILLCRASSHYCTKKPRSYYNYVIIIYLSICITFLQLTTLLNLLQDAPPQPHLSISPQRPVLKIWARSMQQKMTTLRMLFARLQLKAPSHLTVSHPHQRERRYC